MIIKEELIFMQAKYLIIGVNAAGFYAIEALRRHDPSGKIIAVNGEEYLPYKRTKINKKFYPDKLDITKFQLADPDWYNENKITLLNNTKVLSIDISNKSAELDNGKIVKWDKLLISTGAESNSPSSEVFKKAVSIRSYKDALDVKDLINTSQSCLVYGLGIEGVETAAQLREAGLNVTLSGRSNVLLNRYFSKKISEKIEKLFESHNITILYRTTTEGIRSIVSDTKLDTSICVTAVSLKRKCATNDFLLYSLGIKPRIALAESSGIKTENGILVNSKMETSITNIYAAGDCTQLESGTITDHWHSAQDQGRTAAANMAGLVSTWPLKKYRIKVDLFGTYFFSMRPFLEHSPKELDLEESVLSSGAYRLFYYENDLLKGVEMAGDKSRAKLYELAVNEEWDRNKVREYLS
jgi:NAD(P)H-nitrite reductase large subunit